MKGALLISLAALIAASPAAAQDTAAAPACELHVWPAERFQAMTTGWGAGFGMLGALADSAGHANGDKARRSHLASALDSQGQLDSLTKLELAKLLNLPASQVITHSDPLDRKTVNKIKTRRADSKAACYNELVVMDVLYTKSAVWGRALRTTFMLRSFPAGSGEPVIRKSTGGNGLKIFPVKPGEDTTAADAELADIFQRNFTEAAGNWAKQASR